MRQYRIKAYILLQTILLFASITVFSQELSNDSLFVSFGQMLVLKDSVIIPASDTIIVLQSDEKYKIKKNPYYKSQSFYDSLKVKSKGNKLSSELYKLAIKEQSKTNNIDISAEYVIYEGLTINAIHITHVDVMAGTVTDTNIVATSKLSKFLNKTHVHTKENIIRKNLIIHKGETIDANRMADNERILRSLNYIEDAQLIVVPIDENNADIIVVIKDLFPIAPGLSYSSINKFDIILGYKNIIGSGQGIEYRALYDSEYSPKIGNQLEYDLNNISNSFIELKLKYRETPINSLYSADINKAFLTPETRYAGGAGYEYERYMYPLQYTDSTVIYNYIKDNEKIWIGRSFLLSSEKRKNLMFSMKFQRNHFQKRPVVTPDTNQLFQNTSLLLGNITILKNKPIKTRYLKGFGIIEDVPVGYMLSFTTGYLWSDIQNMYYGGIRLGAGYSLKKGGYYGIKVEYGSFYDFKNALQGVFTGQMLYYSPLINLNRSKMRYFISLEYNEGIGRYNYEWINLKDNVEGLSSYNTRGTSKTTLTTEAIYFSNAYLYGFRFAPYAVANLGLIRYNDPVIYTGELHTGIGIGVRIRNESFVIQTIDFSFIYFPHNPTGDEKFKFISKASDPETFDNLQVGEPYIIPFK